MKKWYFTVALMAAWLGQAGIANAQNNIPTPFGAARLADPLPCGPTPPGPDLVPGPIDPRSTPPVPEAGMSYPADHTSAFQCEEFSRDDHWFVHDGSLLLLRQKLGSQTIVGLDPNNLKNGFQSAGTQPIQNLTDIGPDWNPGAKLTVGYLWQNEALEVTGFYLPQYHNSTGIEAPGQLDLPFVNPPLGFEGDNGMWLHADTVSTTFKSTMWNAEINYRYNDPAIIDTELIVGLRYLDLSETLGIFTGDDDFSFPTANGPDPTRQASYTVQTHNRIIAPQLGFEWGHKFTEYFTVGINAKAAVGVDLEETHSSLYRGDGFKGFDVRTSTFIGPSQIYEGGAFLDFNILERMRLRVGYNAMFLVNVATADENIDFNLADPNGQRNDKSSIFYHGPMAEFQFLF